MEVKYSSALLSIKVCVSVCVFSTVGLNHTDKNHNLTKMWLDTAMTIYIIAVDKLDLHFCENTLYTV